MADGSGSDNFRLPEVGNDELKAAGNALLQSLRALALELPFPVFNAHASVVQDYLRAVENVLEQELKRTKS